MKKFFFVPLLTFWFVANSQCLVPNGVADTLFPVTNNFFNNVFGYPADVSRDPVSVFNVRRHKDIIYLLGNFRNLAVNHGPALVLDSATHTVITPQKWRVNGLVHVAIP